MDFRLCFRIAPNSGLSILEPSTELSVLADRESELEIWPRSSEVISNAEWLVLTGEALSELERTDDFLLAKQGTGGRRYGS